MAIKPENERYFRKADTRGRPSKLTPEIQDKICSFLGNGCYLETAAACADINKDTLFEWLRQSHRDKAEGKESKYTIFSVAVEKAMEESERNAVDVINKAAQKNWFAAAWRLERRNPKRWALGKREEEVNDENKPTTEVTLNYSLDSDPKNK